ncbi:MAG: LON peptidase substrate-binding domain-containing protein [Chitinophagaceae bacterium]
MINFIPIFPLSIVVYPGEELNLHIFEERYKQLITECYAEAKPFGIPTVLNSKIAEVGTLVQITEIVKIYEDTRMDIRTKGISVFRILELINSVPEKLYSGAIVNYPDNNDAINKLMMRRVIAGIRELHRLLKVDKDFKKSDEKLLSYDVAHHAGLSLEEEYELLGLLHEDQRLEYLKRHLNKMLPIIAGAENLKEKIKLNGHFKELKGF